MIYYEEMIDISLINGEPFERKQSLIIYLPILSASLFVVVLTLACTLKHAWRHSRIFCTSTRLMSPSCSKMENTSREKTLLLGSHKRRIIYGTALLDLLLPL